MVMFWLVAFLGFLVAEGLTVALLTLWFAVGSLAALISAYFGAPVWLQIMWFCVISCVTFWFARPAIKKHVNEKKQATNADRFIGMSGVVTDRIDNLANTGYVTISGEKWPARSLSGQVIEPGTIVVSCDIRGVKLIVESAEQPVSI